MNFFGLLSTNNAAYFLNNTWQGKGGCHCSTSPPSLVGARNEAGDYLRQSRLPSLARWRGALHTAQDRSVELGKNSNTKRKRTEKREADTRDISVKFCSNNKREKYLEHYMLLSRGQWPLLVRTPQATSAVAFPGTWTTVKQLWLQLARSRGHRMERTGKGLWLFFWIRKDFIS